jgi:hypothetical protein
VNAVLGTSVGAGEPGEGPSNHITTCMYSDASLLIRVSPEIGDQEHAAYPFESPQPVPGLGDDALFSKTSSGTPTSALSVLKGTVEISVFYDGPGDRLMLMTQLAEKALAKL